jgi:hypothetical protein
MSRYTLNLILAFSVGFASGACALGAVLLSISWWMR